MQYILLNVSGGHYILPHVYVTGMNKHKEGKIKEMEEKRKLPF